MSERTEFLRSETLKTLCPAITSPEGQYFWFKGYMENRFCTNILRRGLAKGYELAHATPVIRDRQLIVGLPNYRPLTEAEALEWEELQKMNVGMSPLGGQDSHMAIDYAKILKLGISGIRDEVNGYLSALDLTDPESLEKCDFYKSCLACLDGLSAYAAHYAAYARELAELEQDETRKNELSEIARVLSRVPEYPATTFREALQAVHFVTFPLEGLYQWGRPDRYLIDYYRRDIAAGILTREEALELITCCCILFNDFIPRGLAVGLMVGGRDKDGKDVTNELTYLFLESIDLTRMAYPGLCLCYDKDTPEDVLELACRLIGKGYSHPAIFNDEIITQGLKNYGLPPEHACEYIHSTCVEITPCTRSAVWVASPYHNLTQYLLDILAREDIDAAAPDFTTLKSLYRAHLGERIREECIAQNRTQLNRRLYGGNPMVSCFVNDCLARGRDIDNGGATYNWIMPSFVGMSNLADSLMTLKKLVYERHELTLSELYGILKDDFAGNEVLRQKILNGIDKYGNDCEEPDELADEITSWITGEIGKYRTYRGGRFIPSLFCWVMHERFGRDTMATPDGRTAHFPFGDGSGPAQGREKNGPTASVISSTKWNHTPFIGGIAVNLKFSKKLFSEDSLPKLMTLIKTYLQRGGFEIQLNVTDRETLLKAQKNPENYGDLVVRIGGYSDYFVHIGKNMQDEVILRTEHES